MNIPRFCLVVLAMALLPARTPAQFLFVTNNGAITITGYAGSDAEVVIPDTTNGYPITAIGDFAFYTNSTLAGIAISTNVNSIGLESFDGCTNLTSVTIPNGVTNIGAGAFGHCFNLTNVTVSGSVAFIDYAAFYWCYNLTQVYFEGNAPALGTDPYGGSLGVFASDYDATAFFPPGTAGWGSDFGGLPTWSAYYTTNNGTIGIAQYAGYGGAVALPAQIHGLPVTSIGTNAFAYNSSVTTVTIPAGVTNIGDEAFHDCTNLTAFYFQGNAPMVGDAVFDDTTNATIYFPPDATGWGTNFDGLTAWPFYPFTCTTNHGALTITGYTGNGGAVLIPDSITGLPVTGIAIDAFAYNTSLTSVTIPGSLTSLGSVAFQWCTNLKAAYFEGNAIDSAYSDAFAQDTNLVVYYLPGTQGWSSMYEGHPTALWLPQLQAGAPGPGGQANPFSFNIHWTKGRTVIVEACTNFLSPAWQPLQTNTLATPSTNFSDPLDSYGRFYRVRSP